MKEGEDMLQLRRRMLSPSVEKFDQETFEQQSLSVMKYEGAILRR